MTEALNNCAKKLTLLGQVLFTSKNALCSQDHFDMETKMPMRFAPNPLCNANLQQLLQPQPRHSHSCMFMKERPSLLVCGVVWH